MFNDFLKADSRLSLLLLLREAGGTASESTLHHRLGEIGHRVARPDLRTDLSWLHDRGLVIAHSGGITVSLTPRGLDLAGGPLPSAEDDDGEDARLAAAA